MKTFQELYKERKFDIPNAVFQSWLTLKLATLPTEKEALQSVLESRTPSGLPKRVTKQGGRKVPNGMAWFDPTSEEWRKIHEEKMETLSKKSKDKDDNKNGMSKKNGRKKVVGQTGRGKTKTKNAEAMLVEPIEADMNLNTEGKSEEKGQQGRSRCPKIPKDFSLG